MKLVTIAVVSILALGTTSASIYAQGRGNGQAKRTTVSGPKAKSTAQPTRTAKAETRAVKSEARAAKAEARATRPA